MEITGVDFVAVPSTDWKRSRAFYVDTLGLRPDATGQAEFWVGQTCFGIYEPTTFGLEFAPQTTAHLALHVDDVATARAELEAKGVEFQGETFDTGVCHMAFFSDPDGNALMLHHRYAPREGGRDMITVERSDFVSVPVTDLERSTAFYRDTLGLEQVGHGGWPEFQLGENVSLYLLDPTNIGREFAGPHSAPIALRVRDVEDARRSLEAKGVRFHGETFDTAVCHGPLRRSRRQRAHAPPEVRVP